MTVKSRFLHFARPLVSPFSVKSYVWKLWHIPCIVLGTGCYIGPINVYDTNAEPVFLTLSSHSPDSALLLDQDPKKIWVVVEDDQQEPLTFYWTIGDSGSLDDIITNAEYTYSSSVNHHSSTISLAADADKYDGKTLTCIAIDDGDNESTISWTLEVPQ